ncbi:MAG: NAD(+) diphosphatase [Acidobacteriota bacterium]
MEHSPNFLAGAAVDRAGHRRKDEAWLEAALTSAETLLLPLSGGQALVGNGEELKPVLVSPNIIGGIVEQAPALVFLGVDGEKALFAFDVSAEDQPLLASKLSELGRFADFREIGGLLSHADGALIAYARGLLAWHRAHRYCPSCGRQSEITEGGHVRFCASCNTQHHPRTDPAVIMLVSRGDQCLLGRQASWPENLYSTLAGFVEPGESLEDAVRREVAEEAGVSVGAVHYHSSQPWPFPSSLMIGFHAEALTTEIDCRDAELEEARWFSRDELKELVETREVRLSRPVSIARRLIDEWLQR